MPRKTALVPIAVLLVFLAAGTARALRGRIALRDFEVNVTAGDRLLHGETLYRDTDEHYQFKYSPFCAILYAPFSLVPPVAAKAAWFALVLAAIAFGLAAAARLAGSRCREALPACLLPGLLLAKYFFRELELGQINAVITAVFLGLGGLLVAPVRTGAGPRREAAAGCLWGLGTAMKPYGLIFLPYFLLKKRWAALAAGLGVLGASLVAPAVFYGFAGDVSVHSEWVRSLSRSTPSLLTSQDNISLLGFFSKWIDSPGLAQALFALAALALAAAALAIFLRNPSREDSPVLETALLLLLIPLLSPLGWDYTFLSSILAVALIVREFSRFPAAGRILLGLDLAFIALSIYDILGRRMYAAMMAGSVLTLAFLALVPALFYLRWKKIR